MTDQEILDHLSRVATEAANALSEVAWHCRKSAYMMENEKNLAFWENMKRQKVKK